MLRWVVRVKALGGGCVVVLVMWLAGAVLFGTVLNQYDTPLTMKLVSNVPLGLYAVFAFFVLGGGRLFRSRSKRLAASGTHGTAGFAAKKQLEARGLLSAQGLLCGRSLERGEMIRFNEPGHLVTIAPTRAGKGVGAVIPNALKHPGSLIVIDPKGENARITARARRELYQNVFVLDPFGVSGFPSAHFNPLDFVRSGTEDAAEDADLVAEMLSETEGTKSSSSAHFEESARMLLRGVVLYVAETAPAHLRNLGEVRRLLTLPPDDFNEFLEEMSASDVAYGSAARSANAVRSMADREQSGVVSTVRRYTDWLESPRFVRVLGRSDFSLEQLKQGKTTIFLVLPPDKLQRYRAFNRLFVGLSLSVLQRDAYEKPVGRVLFLLDEIAQLGYLSPLESAVGVAAGYGITLWQFWQDLSQLKSIYKERWESFISNAAVLQVFGVSDHGTAHYVSDLLGQATVQTVGQSSGVSLGGGGGVGQNDGQSISEAGRALLTVDEVRRLDEAKQILFVRGMRPIIAAKLKYYQDRELVGLFDANPMQ